MYCLAELNAVDPVEEDASKTIRRSSRRVFFSGAAGNGSVVIGRCFVFSRVKIFVIVVLCFIKFLRSNVSL
jgi:hypothetical protein